MPCGWLCIRYHLPIKGQTMIPQVAMHTRGPPHQSIPFPSCAQVRYYNWPFWVDIARVTLQLALPTNAPQLSINRYGDHPRKIAFLLICQESTSPSPNPPPSLHPLDVAIRIICSSDSPFPISPSPPDVIAGALFPVMPIPNISILARRSTRWPVIPWPLSRCLNSDTLAPALATSSA